MQEMNPLEKQLQSWIPRRPSAKIARRLFAQVAPTPVFLRRAEVWHWLTPITACVLTLLVVVHSASRRLPRLSVPDDATFFATLMVNAATSNMQQTFALSKMDENVEWNVWPHLASAQTARWTAPHSSMNVWNVMPTNR
jgi:hypothetical protein